VFYGYKVHINVDYKSEIIREIKTTPANVHDSNMFEELLQRGRERRMKENMKFDILLEKAEEGGYNVIVPALESCFSHGETIEEAVENVREAIVYYFEWLQKINRAK